MKRVASAIHLLPVDAWSFVLLVGGYTLVFAIRFDQAFASGLILLLASGAIALYLSGGARRRFVLVWCAIAAIAIAPTVLGIYLRHVTAPYEYAHDGMIQTEEAIRFLLAGKNPYAENYVNTPMALWHFQEPNLSVNPALYHLPYLPFFIIFSTPFYIAAQAIVGWFDERMIFLPMFVATLVLFPFLAKSRARLFAVTLIVGLNPLLVSFLAEGRNDVFVLFWIVLSLVLLQANRRVLSVIALACACASKQTAWFIVPFYLAYCAYDENKTSSPREALANSLLPVSVFVGVFAVLVIPFFLWNPQAFIDDIFRFNAGLTEYAYPIKSLGFGGIALALGWIPTNTAQFPFEIPQLVFGVPTLVGSLRFQIAQNNIPRLWLCYGFLTLVIAFFSRIFNDNHLGYIVSLFVLGLFSEAVGSQA